MDDSRQVDDSGQLDDSLPLYRTDDVLREDAQTGQDLQVQEYEDFTTAGRGGSLEQEDTIFRLTQYIK